MAFQERIETEIQGAATDESADSESGQDEGPTGPSNSPFSMDYEVNAEFVESEELNNVLTALVAVTNLI